jgi:hypothetical protein
MSHMVGVISLCHGWIDNDPSCRGRRTQITPCEAAPHSVGSAYAGPYHFAVKLGKGRE